MSNWQCGPSGCTNINQMPLGGRNAGGSSGPIMIPLLQGSSSGGSSCSGGGGGTCSEGAMGSLPDPGSGGNPTPTPEACCLDGAALVLMGDGSLKRAESVEVGDILLGQTEAGCPRNQTVIGIKSADQPRLRISLIGLPDLVCTPSHPLASINGGWIQAGGLNAGDKLLGENGEKVEITAVEEIDSAQVYIWTCEPDHTFFAGGVLHHNLIKQVYSYPGWL
jgi:hypothetical protein